MTQLCKNIVFLLLSKTLEILHFNYCECIKNFMQNLKVSQNVVLLS